ncbi:MAG: dipeptidase [Bacteroidales bacterium]|nr:dipeptidase [Bacteroidales bacterium]MBN2819178.1 dipeptidase [Bacteroidales bacterium]
MDKIKDFINTNKERILNELFDFIRIPSVSAKPENKSAMYDAAQYLKNAILSAGAERAEILETAGWPLVYGEKIIDASKPTVLVYGHYDVQPEEPLELWNSPPFEPEIRDGKIYARGADDDKGQLFMHVKAFEFMVQQNILPCNVKFIFEGEEEIGSESLERFCKQHKELLKADVILVSDTSMISLDVPTITTGLRGLAYFEITLKGQSRDLHSGLFGGAVINPVNELSRLIAGLIDAEGKVTIPGFYNSVQTVSAEERKLLNSVPFDEKKFYAGINLKNGGGEKGFTVIERLGIRPSLDVNGIWGGHISQGAKTVLPAEAHAKISMRLVPDQHPEEIAKLFKDYLQKQIPEDFTIEIEYLHGGTPYVLPFYSLELEAAVNACQKTFGKKPVPVRSGGSIPVISVFEQVLGIKAVLMGFGLESDAIHAPNENYPLDNFFKGLETIPWFYHFYKK